MQQRVLLFSIFFIVAFQAFPQRDSLHWATYWDALQKLNQGSYEEASSAFSGLIKDGFVAREVYLNRGISYYHLDKFENAKTDLEEAIKRGSNTEELFECLGNSEFHLENYRGTVADLNKALTLGSHQVEVFANLGAADFRLGNYKEAILAYDKALSMRRDPTLLNDR